jgi:hypothetical protein
MRQTLVCLQTLETLSADTVFFLEFTEIALQLTYVPQNLYAQRIVGSVKADGKNLPVCLFFFLFVTVKSLCDMTLTLTLQGTDHLQI